MPFDDEGVGLPSAPKIGRDTGDQQRAASALLDALTDAVFAHGPFGDDSRPASWWRAANTAIAQARAAGIGSSISSRREGV